MGRDGGRVWFWVRPYRVVHTSQHKTYITAASQRIVFWMIVIVSEKKSACFVLGEVGSVPSLHLSYANSALGKLRKSPVDGYVDFDKAARSKGEETPT